jgi:hypothetical protein
MEAIAIILCLTLAIFMILGLVMDIAWDRLIIFSLYISRH